MVKPRRARRRRRSKKPATPPAPLTPLPGTGPTIGPDGAPVCCDSDPPCPTCPFVQDPLEGAGRVGMSS